MNNMFYRTSEYTAADAGDTVLAIYAYHEHGCHRLFSALTSTRIPFLYPPPPRLTAPRHSFDHSKFRYDHHQRGFAETMNSLDASKPWTTKLSSAGLVYQHYGRRVISQVLGLEEGDATIEILFDKMYANFIEEYDGKDNGVNQYDGEALYTVNSTVGQRVARLAPSWNE